jgi:hypothetical protein
MAFTNKRRIRVPKAPPNESAFAFDKADCTVSPRRSFTSLDLTVYTETIELSAQLAPRTSKFGLGHKDQAVVILNFNIIITSAHKYLYDCRHNVGVPSRQDTSLPNRLSSQQLKRAARPDSSSCQFLGYTKRKLPSHARYGTQVS